MTRERPTPKQLIDDALTRLEDALRAGRSAQLEAYLALCSRFHSYSFGNVLLIATQWPHATQVAGFHAWKKLGRWVRKGERGMAIIAPQPIKRRRREPAEDDETDLLMRDDRPAAKKVRETRRAGGRQGLRRGQAAAVRPGPLGDASNPMSTTASK